MKCIFVWLSFICLLAGVSKTALADEGSSADALIQNGIAVLQQIDRDGSGDVWEGAASFVKAKLPKDTFVKSIRQARSTIGTATQRRWASVVRVRYNTQTGDTPPGLYANIDYATDLRDGTTVFELVSFQLDPNGIWRVTGYIPRNKQ